MQEQDKQKQIEEMRKDLIEIFDEEYEERRLITADFTAIKMTAKGYCKQSDGDGLLLTFDGATGYFPKEFIIEAIKTHMKQSEGEWKERTTGNGWNCWSELTCSKCGVAFEDKYGEIPRRFCPNCGAKMKGGAE